MNLELLLFGIASFSSVLLYYVIADKANWKQRSVVDFETTYWNAFQTFIWSLGLILVRGGPTPSIWSSIMVVPTAIIYGLITEQPGMDFDLTGNKPLTTTQIAFLSVIGVLVFFYIIVLLYNQDYTNPISIVWKFVPLLLFIIWMLTWLGVNKANTSSSTTQTFNPGHETAWGQYVQPGFETITTISSYNLHIHHWIIAVIGFLLSTDSAVYSQVVSGLFWGVFCQEAAAYGIAIPSDPRQTTSSSYQQTGLGPGGTRSASLGPGGTHM